MQKKTIVYIEDRAEDIQLLKRVIQKDFENINLITCDDSEKVMQDIESGDFAKHTAQLVLLDINMPKVTGLELLEALNKTNLYQNLPKVIFSSSKLTKDINKAYGLQCNSYVEKPNNYSTFKKAIHQTLSYWLDINLN